MTRAIRRELMQDLRQRIDTYNEAIGCERLTDTIEPQTDIMSSFTIKGDIVPTLSHLRTATKLYEAGRGSVTHGVSTGIHATSKDSESGRKLYGPRNAAIQWLQLKDVSLNDKRLPKIAAIVGGNKKNLSADELFGYQHPSYSRSWRMNRYELVPGQMDLRMLQMVGYANNLLGISVSFILPAVAKQKREETLLS